MNAIGYIRVSTDEQCQGVSLDAQRSKVIAYSQLKDMQLSEIVEDAGISAKNISGRPGLQRILALARKKKVEAIIVYKLDRIFRSTIDALETTQMLERQGVSLHSINENLDTCSPIGRFFFTLTAALAEMERRLIGERTKSALAHKRSLKESTGGYAAPYGFDLDDTGHLFRNEHEQKGIKLIKSLNDKGLSLRLICRELESNGYKTKTGKDTWSPKIVLMILRRVSRKG